MKGKFEEFNDGIVDLYAVNDDGKLEKVTGNLRFGRENVSVTRHYAARAADTRADSVIHVPWQQAVKPQMVAVIAAEQFDIDKVDHIKTTLPPITRMTLIRFEKHKEKEFA